MFQKRHYLALAEAIRDVAVVYQGEDGPVYSVAQSIADMLQQDSPLFQRETFMRACGMPDTPLTGGK